MDRNEPKLTEINRNGQKWTEMDRIDQNISEMFDESRIFERLEIFGSFVIFFFGFQYFCQRFLSLFLKQILKT